MKTKQLLANYVNAAADLAESIRNDIQHNNEKVSNKTVLALNKFVVSANDIQDLEAELNHDNHKLN
jgi:hypothetical protein